METHPKVSIITAVYDEPKEWIEKCLKSVKIQQKIDYEHIIILDNPERKSKLKKIIKQFPHVRFFQTKGHTGASNARNIGISNAKGEYIAILDADDYYIDPFKLKEGIEYMEKKDLYILGTNARVVDENDKLVKNPSGKVFNLIKGNIDYNTIKKNIFKYNYFIHSSVIIKKEVFDKIGLYDIDLKRAQDYDLFLRTVPYFKAEVIDKKTITYRQKTKSADKYKLDWEYRLKALRKALSLKHYNNLPNWLYYLMNYFAVKFVPVGLILKIKNKI